ncbi:hypothetical protein SDC9_143025 [bioreactor metagenome]|uniref:Uncharacterized protein n=1 Tax=bioreactor metagenome TaxID=1076179 RepID=A0A645E2V8_9ZZZZ
MFVIMNVAGENHRHAVFLEQRLIGLPHRHHALALAGVGGVRRVVAHRGGIDRMVENHENMLDAGQRMRPFQFILQPFVRRVAPPPGADFHGDETAVAVAKRIIGPVIHPGRYIFAILRDIGILEARGRRRGVFPENLEIARIGFRTVNLGIDLGQLPRQIVAVGQNAQSVMIA